VVLLIYLIITGEIFKSGNFDSMKAKPDNCKQVNGNMANLAFIAFTMALCRKVIFYP